MNGNSSKPSRDRGPLSVASRLRTFCEYTTAHGLGRLGAQRSFIGHTLWLIFIFATYSGLAYHMYTLLDRFLAVPLLTGLSTSLAFEFPDVYFCPSAGALSISKISETYNQAEVQHLRGLRKACNLSCQRALSKLDIVGGESGGKAVRLSRVMLALTDALAATEKSIIDTYRLDFKRQMNLTNCRYTEAGEEYTGGTNTVPVYSSSLTFVANKPYVIYQPCLSWNAAASRLASSEVAAAMAAAADLLKVGFDAGDNRCRQPRGLPLSKFHEFATRPLQDAVTCASKASPGPVFNHSCFTVAPARITVELCAECCYAKNFTYIGLQGDSCYCDNAYLSLPESNNCDIACSGDESQLCGGDSELSVFLVRPPGDKPLMIPFGSNMSRSFGGPYCFYVDSEDRLSASYCDIPFCPAPPAHDCAVGATEEAADRRQLSVYSGYTNVTTKGRECMAWSTVKRRIEDGSLRLLNVLDLLEEPSSGAKVIALYIQTPDYALSNSTNYCRAARVLFDARIEVEGTYLVIRDTALNSVVPGCFYLNEVEEQVFFESCNVKHCYESSLGVSGSIRDRVGSALLARQFSGGMTIGFTDCHFFNQRCTQADFENVQHPELGVCHRFIKENYVRELRSSQVAEAQLELKYFTDSSDTLGRRFDNMSKMSGAVHNGAPDVEIALTVIVVPDGVYPWTANAISVSPAQRKGVLLRYDKTVRFSKPPKYCLKSLPRVTYALMSWYPNSSKEAELPPSYTEAVFKEANWSDKIEKLRVLLEALSAAKGPVQLSKQYRSVSREHCINEFILKQFISNCNCLPSFLPIPVHMAQATRLCFNHTNAESLHQSEQCYKRQLDSIEYYRMVARADCYPPCETPSYSIREVSHPWPNVKRERALSFLSELAGLHGYPNDVKPTRGPVSLYYAYLRALELSRVPPNARNLSDLVDFAYEIDIVQDRLAMVTVQASQPFGDEIVEEEAYPVKNLLADMGGALGLWCGVSVLTMCEVLELCSILGLALSRRHPGLLRRQSSVSRAMSAYTVPVPELPLSDIGAREARASEGTRV